MVKAALGMVGLAVGMPMARKAFPHFRVTSFAEGLPHPVPNFNRCYVFSKNQQGFLKVRFNLTYRESGILTCDLRQWYNSNIYIRRKEVPANSPMVNG